MLNSEHVSAVPLVAHSRDDWGSAVQRGRPMVIAAAPTSPLVRSPMERRKISLTTGTRLVREWRGVTYTVLVHTDGFEWNGRRLSVPHNCRP